MFHFILTDNRKKVLHESDSYETLADVLNATKGFTRETFIENDETGAIWTLEEARVIVEHMERTRAW